MSTLRQTHQSHMAEITGDNFQTLSDRLDEILAQIGDLRSLLEAQAKPPEPAPESEPSEPVAATQ